MGNFLVFGLVIFPFLCALGGRFGYESFFKLKKRRN
jgi:hypothetical protein